MVSVGMLKGLCEKLPTYGNVEKKGEREADGGIGKSRPKASKCLHYSLQLNSKIIGLHVFFFLGAELLFTYPQ